MNNTARQHPCIVPTLKYDNAKEAVGWLVRAFGFEEDLVVEGENATIAHAQLSYRNSKIMLSSAGDGAFDTLQKPPTALGGVGSQSAYIIVEDADEHYRRATAAGAEVVMELVDEDYGGRGYSCRDPEGHVWNFGTYDPWA